MAQRLLRALFVLPKVLSSILTTIWWLTTICDEIWFRLLARKHAGRQTTVYLINKSLKKIKNI